MPNRGTGQATRPPASTNTAVLVTRQSSKLELQLLAELSVLNSNFILFIRIFTIPSQ